MRRGHIAGLAQANSVYIDACGAERLLQIEKNISVSPQTKPPGGDPVGIFVFVEQGEIWIFTGPRGVMGRRFGKKLVRG